MVFSFQNSFEPMLGYTKSNSIEENQVREKSRHAWKSYLLRTEIDKKKKLEIDEQSNPLQEFANLLTLL